MQSVVLLDAKTKKKSERLIDLQQDRDAIGKAMDGTANCKLLINLDPINAYLGKTDSYKNAEVRQVLGPVAEMCHRKGVAFRSLISAETLEQDNQRPRCTCAGR